MPNNRKETDLVKYQRKQIIRVMRKGFGNRDEAED